MATKTNVSSVFMPKRPARLIDVAIAAKVSQGTVSNVFNRPEMVNEETREKVFQAAKTLNYKGPHAAGRLLRAGRTDTIGVLISSRLSYFFQDPVARTFMSGIANVCDGQGVGITLISAQDETKAAQSIRNALVDGFIVHCLEEDAHLVALARSRNLPLTVVDSHLVEGAHNIRVDNEKGAYMAAQHLLDLGHRQIGILTLKLQGDAITGPPSSKRLADIRYETGRKRMIGYQAALKKAGIDTPPEMIYECGNDRFEAADGARYLLSQPSPPTAIIAMSDMIGLGVLDFARAAGLRVPQQLSVIGYDDMMDASFSDPPLTTINQPSMRKGHMAATALLSGAQEHVNKILPVNLVLRQSTAPPRNDPAP